MPSTKFKTKAQSPTPSNKKRRTRKPASKPAARKGATPDKQTGVHSGTVLNKYVSTAGISSRRKAAELIKAGSVTVNGKVVKDPSYRVQKGDRVEAMGQSVSAGAQKYVYILMNKPAECLTSVYDDKGRRTVIDLLGGKIKERIYPVGRLDWETTGALLLTNDGDLTQKLNHPSHEVDKEYHAILNRPLSWEHIHEIKKGVRLTDGIVHVDNVAFFTGKRKNQVRIVLHSGKYRVIRRLFKKLGFEVDSLDRARYAHLTTRRLPKGGWRLLTPQEVARLKK